MMRANQIVQILVGGVWFAVLTVSCNNAHKQKKAKPIADDITKLAALPSDVPTPADNPTTSEKVALGKLLFFDPILSGNKDVACATCHHPEFGFAESLEISIGVNGHGVGSNRVFNSPNDIPFVKRNAQTILNTAFNGITLEANADPENAPMFWDLRSKSLEKQALEPIKALEEMRGNSYNEHEILENIIGRLQDIPAYQKLFKKAFDNEPDAITILNLSRAIAAYERTLVGGNTRFDKYLRGDNTALSLNEIDGLKAFLKSGCTKCHHGPMLSDFKLHTLGIADNAKLPKSDSGANSKYAFRTPSLRNLRYTAPYMHNGKFQTLQQVLEFYEDLGGDKIQNPKVDKTWIDPLTASIQVDFKDISLIIEFLHTLNDENFDRTIPKSVPSGLLVGGNLK